MSSIPPDLNKNGWSTGQGQSGMYSGDLSQQYGQRHYPMPHYPSMMSGYEHHFPTYPGYPNEYYQPLPPPPANLPPTQTPIARPEQAFRREAIGFGFGLDKEPYETEYHRKNEKALHSESTMSNPIPEIVPSIVPSVVPSVPQETHSPFPPQEMSQVPVIRKPTESLKNDDDTIILLPSQEPELAPPESAVSEELTNSTTSDSESHSTESNSPVFQRQEHQQEQQEQVEQKEQKQSAEVPESDPNETLTEEPESMTLGAEITIEETSEATSEATSEEKTPEKTEKTTEETLVKTEKEPETKKPIELICSFSQVFSSSFVPPSLSPVVTKKEPLPETDEEEDTRAAQFWSDPALDRYAPPQKVREKRKYTRRVPKAEATPKPKPIAKGRGRKKRESIPGLVSMSTSSGSRSSNDVAAPRKRKLEREESQDTDQLDNEKPSTSYYSSGSLNYSVSVDVNLESSASELNSPNFTSDDGEPRKKTRKRRDSKTTMTYKKRKNSRKDSKTPSKAALGRMEREKKKLEHSQVVNENRKNKFRDASLQFKFETDLEYALETFGSRYSEESIEKVKKYLAAKKRARKNPHYLRTDISFDAKFPDEDDYRHCTAYREEATIGTTMPLSTRRSGGKVPPAAPPLTLFGTLYTDLNTSAHDVQEHAKNWFKIHRNDVFKKSDVFGGPEPDENLAELERRFYKEKYGDTSLDGFTGVDRNRIQTPVLNVKTPADLENENLKRILNSASITVVSGICKAAGINMSLFDLDVLKDIDKSLMIDCLFQNPQSADNNFNCQGEKMWRTSGIRLHKKLKWFSNYMQKRYHQAEKYLKEMAKSSDMKETEEKILEKMVEEQDEIPENADKSMFWSIFGTNIDLQDREMFPEQHVHLDKLPEFLRPKFDGNLLNLIGEDVLGINTVQVYVKPPGARTAAHMENALMASININLGPGKCVWFAVPYEYWGKLAALVKSKGLTYHGQDYWPDEEELRAVGIPVQKFEQKPDELVYVNTGCFHWVQSSGYCVNVSWNVGQPTALQMSTSMIATTHNVLSRYQDHVPIMKIAWRIAKEKLYMDDEEMYKIIRSILIRTLAHSTWYEDELRVTGKKIFREDQLEFPVPAVVRCIQCGAEVFNVIKWYLGNKDIPSTFFCNRCHPKSEHTDGRDEAYTILTSREELMKIMDSYKKRWPDATSSSLSSSDPLL